MAEPAAAEMASGRDVLLATELHVPRPGPGVVPRPRLTGHLDEGLEQGLQRPALAVTCTAGLAALHDMEPWCGIDIDDLDSRHSLGTDPTVARLRETAAMLGEDIWIAVKLPGEFKDDDDLQDGTAIRRWTTVVLYPDELGWLREALAPPDRRPRPTSARSTCSSRPACA
jgi:hypothetical protein